MSFEIPGDAPILAVVPRPRDPTRPATLRAGDIVQTRDLAVDEPFADRCVLETPEHAARAIDFVRDGEGRCRIVRRYHHGSQPTVAVLLAYHSPGDVPAPAPKKRRSPRRQA